MNYNFYLLMFGIIGLLAFSSIFIFPQSSIPNSDNLFGHASYPSPDYSFPIDTFFINHDVIDFETIDDRVDFLVSIADDNIFKQGYLSLDGGEWIEFTLTGNEGLYSEWYKDSASTGFKFTPADFGLDLSNLRSEENYIILFSCSDGTSEWDCHDMKWQLHQFTATLQNNNIPNPAACIDTDGGIDEFVYGEVTIKEVVTVDVCSSMLASTLEEYYCDGDLLGREIISCSYGCIDGACVQKTG